MSSLHLELLGEVAVGGADDVDAREVDGRLDGLARLDGEAGDEQSAGGEDADVSLVAQRRLNNHLARLGVDVQHAVGHLALRRVGLGIAEP